MANPQRRIRERSTPALPSVSPMLTCLVLLVAASAWPQLASAKDLELEARQRSVESPENFVLELRGGPYRPNMNPAFDQFFGGDSGPLLGLEFDVLPLRIRDVLAFGVGFGIGTATYSGDACEDLACDAVSAEGTRLRLVPLTGLAVLRIDALARQLDIPLILTAKLGFDRVAWSTSRGAGQSVSGWSTALRMAGQVALDLNFFDRRAARSLDEEWGINRSFVFFELWRTSTLGQRSLEVDDTSWSIGLGLGF